MTVILARPHWHRFTKHLANSCDITMVFINSEITPKWGEINSRWTTARKSTRDQNEAGELNTNLDRVRSLRASAISWLSDRPTSSLLTVSSTSTASSSSSSSSLSSSSFAPISSGSVKVCVQKKTFPLHRCKFWQINWSSSSFYLFIKQFHKSMTAYNTRTGPTRLAKHSQWPQ